MPLKKGITGFSDNRQSNKGKSNIKEDEFTEWVNIVGNTHPYRINEIILPQLNTNFYRVKMLDLVNILHFDVLFNCIHPVFCGLNSASEWMNFTFMDLPDDLLKLLESKFEYLKPQTLNRQPSINDLKDLDKVEINQIKYWQTYRIGDIIFNGYD